MHPRIFAWKSSGCFNFQSFSLCFLWKSTGILNALHGKAAAQMAILPICHWANFQDGWIGLMDGWIVWNVRFDFFLFWDILEPNGLMVWRCHHFCPLFSEVDSRPRVSTSCRGGSHHSIGNVQWHGCTSAAGSGSLERSFSKFDVAGCECWWSFWELWGEKLRTIASEEAVGNWWALAFAVDMFLQRKHDASQPDVARFWSSFL